MRTRAWAWARLWTWLWAALLLACVPSQAQTLESALSPGPVIQGHAKVEADCGSCHVRFDRAAQDKLCMTCHKDVAADWRGKTGLHGRLKPQACRTCHTDHRGRDMRVAAFNPKTFDHRGTDYPLRDAHARAECASCHKPGQKFSQAPSDCLSCHRKDDVHKGKLGAQCADCHSERSWREGRFDHDSTRFALTGKHIGPKCGDCHRSADYKGTPTTCVGCHRQVDKHKGRFGDKCESCHGTRDWKGLAFRHDVDTRFALRGKHREARCESCHTGVLYRDKTATACNDCHKKEDKHQGSLGPACGTCHTERQWREVARFDHDRSTFPLRGGHLKPECKACHVSAVFKDAPSDCLACHRKDDKHQGTLGAACADCHTDLNWRATRFAHQRTRFALHGGHAVPPRACADCHRETPRYAKTALDCLSCHRKDDKHQGQLGSNCAQCHDDTVWTRARFDHRTARFQLTGGHAQVKCADCHKTARYRDAPRDCIGCHERKDKHQRRLGTACETCHSVRSWPLWTFDHQGQTDYPLATGHAQVPCEACHKQPATAGKALPRLDRACVACHRGDDAHEGDFGHRCEACHTATRWKQVFNRVGGRAAGTAGPGMAASASPSASSTRTGVLR